MSEKILTKEIAEQFIEDEHSVDLSEFTKIDNAAAEILNKIVCNIFLIKGMGILQI